MESQDYCPVQAQVDAYNARNIDDFLKCYSTDVIIEHITKGEMMRGLEAMRQRYSKMFDETPKLHAHIEKRIRVGNYVMDEEHVSGKADGFKKVGVVYEVKDDLICRVLFVS